MEQHPAILQPERDRAAYLALYHAYSQSMWLFARSILRDGKDAEDVCAEVFIRLWEKRAVLGAIDNPRDYLYRAVRNQCIDFQRKEASRLRRDQESELAVSDTTATSFVDEVRSIVLDQIRKEMEELPAQRRRVVELAYFEGLAADEIARQLNITIAAVYNIKSQALRMLSMRLSTSTRPSVPSTPEPSFEPVASAMVVAFSLLVFLASYF